MYVVSILEVGINYGHWSSNGWVTPVLPTSRNKSSCLTSLNSYHQTENIQDRTVGNRGEDRSRKRKRNAIKETLNHWVLPVYMFLSSTLKDIGVRKQDKRGQDNQLLFSLFWRVRQVFLLAQINIYIVKLQLMVSLKCLDFIVLFLLFLCCIFVSRTFWEEFKLWCREEFFFQKIQHNKMFTMENVSDVFVYVLSFCI